MVWLITFAIAAAVAALVYVAARRHDRDCPPSYRSDARLAALGVFSLFAVLGTLNVLAYVGI